MLIAIEGIDGSGKGTQASMLADKLRRVGATVSLIRFPQYQETFFGREVGRYLNGDYGELEKVPPKFSSLLYALDRFQALEEITRALSNEEYVICDRYTGSNMAHQAARVPGNERTAMINWIQEVEERILKIPKPDLVLFLDMDVTRSQELVAQKEKRSYTEKTHDLHEASADHLQVALDNFRAIARDLHWTRIVCTDSLGNLKLPAVINDEIFFEVTNAKKHAHQIHSR
jgi:dTMP kinase